MKAQWLMIGGAALFVISWAAHDVFNFFSSGWEGTVVSLVIFVSPIIALLGIAIYIQSRMRKKKTPPA